ncbi:MAG: HD domain-containing protein [Desulfovibrio sp.]|jgi:hypothetical protein|nr:HD domain-containing protein [Desulfovibrio sp.]
MTISFEELEKTFQQYVARFFNGEPTNDYHIDLKLRHSLRVYELARRIVHEENLDEETARQACIAALLHDTGRFEQYRRYATFHDPSSENHARLGITALLSSSLTKGLSRRERRCLLGAVFLHNVRDLPPRLREPLGTVTRVVRDSDKLDIIPVVLEHLSAGAAASPVVTLGIEPAPNQYTHSIYQQVLAGQSADYQAMRWYNDFRLLVLGWIADLNFTAAKRIYRMRGYAEALFQDLPDIPEMRRLHETVDQRLGPSSKA